MQQGLECPLRGAFFSQIQGNWSSEVAHCPLPEGRARAVITGLCSASQAKMRPASGRSNCSTCIGRWMGSIMSRCWDGSGWGWEPQAFITPMPPESSSARLPSTGLQDGGAGTCPGWRWKRRAARHCQGWDGVVWGEAAITELPWLLPSSRNALRGRVRPSLSIITTAVMSGDDCLSQAPGVQHRCRHCQRMLIEQPQQM